MDREISHAKFRGSLRISRTPAVQNADSGGGYHTKSRGLRELSHGEIYHREFDLTRNPPSPFCMYLRQTPATNSCRHPPTPANTRPGRVVCVPVLGHGVTPFVATVHGRRCVTSASDHVSNLLIRPSDGRSWAVFSVEVWIKGLGACGALVFWVVHRLLGPRPPRPPSNTSLREGIWSRGRGGGAGGGSTPAPLL